MTLILKKCLAQQDQISFILREILQIILDTESEYKPGESIKNELDNITLAEFFEYINSWYFYNNLSVYNLEDWLKTTDKNDSDWYTKLAQKLVEICKLAGVKNCFELHKYFGEDRLFLT
jgi:hypothetical protein